MTTGTVQRVAWVMSTVGSEFAIQLGKMLDAGRNIGEPKAYLGNRAVQWGHVDISAAGTVPLTPEDQARYRLRADDLLVCEGGEVGRAAIWQDELAECYYQKALHRLRAKRGFSPRLMMGFLEHWAETGEFDRYVTQTSIAHLPRESFLTMPLPVPPPDEQERIADVLNDLNTLIARLAALILKRTAIKEGMAQELLTGRTRLPGFTDAWTRLRLHDVANVDPESLPASTPPDAVLNYISLEDVSRGTILRSVAVAFVEAPSRARRVLRRNDVLFGTVRPNLQSHGLYAGGLSRPIASTGFAVIRAVPNNADPRFLLHFILSRLASTQIGRIIAGSNYPAVSGRDVGDLTIVLPSVDEQSAIADVLSDADAEIDLLKRRLAKAKSIKAGMAQQLLTGRIRLPDLEPVA
jgi:type I restriction enzyme S subunit